MFCVDKTKWHYDFEIFAGSYVTCASFCFHNDSHYSGEVTVMKCSCNVVFTFEGKKSKWGCAGLE